MSANLLTQIFGAVPHPISKLRSCLSALRARSFTTDGAMPAWWTKRGPKSWEVKLSSSLGLCAAPAWKPNHITQSMPQSPLFYKPMQQGMELHLMRWLASTIAVRWEAQASHSLHKAYIASQNVGQECGARL